MTGRLTRWLDHRPFLLPADAHFDTTSALDEHIPAFVEAVGGSVLRLKASIPPPGIAMLGLPAGTIIEVSLAATAVEGAEEPPGINDNDAVFLPRSMPASTTT